MTTENQPTNPVNTAQAVLREKIKQAVRILSLYDSPFPDAQERNIRQTQITYIRELEEELRLQVALDSIR